MKCIDAIKGLQKLGIPCAYGHFNEPQDLPFVVYRSDETSNQHADNYAYFKIVEFDIELYSEIKNPALEQKIEDILTAGEVGYRKTESYLPDEKMYEVLYETEMEDNYVE